MSLNQDLSDLFERMAQLMEIKGENTFKCLAFHKVARVLKDSTINLRQAVENSTLKIEGVGDSSKKKSSSST